MRLTRTALSTLFVLFIIIFLSTAFSLTVVEPKKDGNVIQNLIEDNFGQIISSELKKTGKLPQIFFQERELSPEQFLMQYTKITQQQQQEEYDQTVQSGSSNTTAQAVIFSEDLDDDAPNIPTSPELGFKFDDFFYTGTPGCTKGPVRCWLSQIYLKIPDLDLNFSFMSGATHDLICKDIDVTAIKLTTDTDRSFPTWKPGQTVDIAEATLKLVANSISCTGGLSYKVLLISGKMQITMLLSNISITYQTFAETRDGWSLLGFRAGNKCDSKIGSIKITPHSTGFIESILGLLQNSLGPMVSSMFCTMVDSMIEDLSQGIFEMLVDYLSPYLHEHQPLLKVNRELLKNTFKTKPIGDDVIEIQSKQHAYPTQDEELVNDIAGSLYDQVIIWGNNTIMTWIDRVFNGLNEFNNPFQIPPQTPCLPETNVDSVGNIVPCADPATPSPKYNDSWYFGLLRKNIGAVNCVMDVITNGTGVLTVQTYDYYNRDQTFPNITIPLLGMFNVTVGLPYITAGGLNTFKELTLLQNGLGKNMDDELFDLYNKISLQKISAAINATIILTPLDGEGYTQTVKPLYETFGATIGLENPTIELGLRPVFDVSNFWKSKLGPFCQLSGIIPCVVSLFDGTWDADGGLAISKLIIDTKFSTMEAYQNPGWDTPLELDIVQVVQTLFKMLKNRFPVFLQTYLRQLGGSLIRNMANELIFNMTKDATAECEAHMPLFIDENIDPVRGEQYLKWSQSKLLAIAQFIVNNIIQGVPGYNQLLRCVGGPDTVLGTAIEWSPIQERIEAAIGPTQEEMEDNLRKKHEEFYRQFADMKNLPFLAFHNFSIGGFDSGYAFKFFEPLIQSVDDLGVVFGNMTKDTIVDLADDFKLYTEIGLGSSCKTMDKWVQNYVDVADDIIDGDSYAEQLTKLSKKRTKKMFHKLCSKYVPEHQNDHNRSINDKTEEFLINYTTQEYLLQNSEEYLTNFEQILNFIVTNTHTGFITNVYNQTSDFDTIVQYNTQMVIDYINENFQIDNEIDAHKKEENQSKLAKIKTLLQSKAVLLDNVITEYVNNYLQSQAPSNEFVNMVDKYVKIVKSIKDGTYGENTTNSTNTNTAGTENIFKNLGGKIADAVKDMSSKFGLVSEKIAFLPQGGFTIIGMPATDDVDVIPRGPLKGFASLSMPYTHHFLTTNINIQFDSAELAMQGDFRFNLNTFYRLNFEQLLTSLCGLSIIEGWNFDNLFIRLDQFILDIDVLLDQNTNGYYYNNYKDTTYLSDIFNDLLNDYLLRPFLVNRLDISKSIFDYLHSLSLTSCKAPTEGNSVNPTAFSALSIPSFLTADKKGIRSGVDYSNIINFLYDQLEIPEDINIVNIFTLDFYRDFAFSKLATTLIQDAIPVVQPSVQSLIGAGLELDTPSSNLKWTAVALPLIVLILGGCFLIGLWFKASLCGNVMPFVDFMTKGGRGSTVSPIIVLDKSSPLVSKYVKNPDHAHTYGVVNRAWLLNKNNEGLRDEYSYLSAFSLHNLLTSFRYNQCVTTTKESNLVDFINKQTKIQNKKDNVKNKSDFTSQDIRVIDLTKLSQDSGITVDVLTGSSLIHSPSLSLWYRIAVPTLVLANFLLLITALYTNGAIVRVIFTIMGSTLDLGTVFNFNVTTLIDYFLYGPLGPTMCLFFMFGLFCGVFAFFRVPLFIALWFLPQRILPVRVRHFVCQALSHLSRWLLLEAFILSMFLVAFRMHLPLMQEYVISDTVVNCQAAFWIFLAQSFFSHIIATLTIATHRYSIRNNDSYDIDTVYDEKQLSTLSQTESKPSGREEFNPNPRHSLFSHQHTLFAVDSNRVDFDNEQIQTLINSKDPYYYSYTTDYYRAISKSSSQCTKPQQKYSVRIQLTHILSMAFIIWAALSMVLLWLGVTAKLFKIQLGGMSGWFLTDEYNSSKYSVLDVIRSIPQANMGLYNSQTGLEFLAFVLCVYIIIAPTLFIVLAFILWITPLSLKTHIRFHTFVEALYGWVGLDAFIISVLSSVYELTKLSAALLGDMCDFLTPFIQTTLADAGAMKGYTTCFSVFAFPQIGSLYLLLAAGCTWITALGLFKLSESALIDKMAEQKQMLQVQQDLINKRDNKTQSIEDYEKQADLINHIESTIGTVDNILTLSKTIPQVPFWFRPLAFGERFWLVKVTKQRIYSTNPLSAEYSDRFCSHEQYNTPGPTYFDENDFQTVFSETKNVPSSALSVILDAPTQRSAPPTPKRPVSREPGNQSPLGGIIIIDEEIEHNGRFNNDNIILGVEKDCNYDVNNVELTLITSRDSSTLDSAPSFFSSPTDLMSVHSPPPSERYPTQLHRVSSNRSQY